MYFRRGIRFLIGNYVSNQGKINIIPYQLYTCLIYWICIYISFTLYLRKNIFYTALSTSSKLKLYLSLQWDQFFDLESIRRYVPIVELTEYLKLNTNVIGIVLYLQQYRDNSTGKEMSSTKAKIESFTEEKYTFQKCINEPEHYSQTDQNGINVTFVLI